MNNLYYLFILVIITIVSWKGYKQLFIIFFQHFSWFRLHGWRIFVEKNPAVVLVVIDEPPGIVLADASAWNVHVDDL